MPTIEQLRQKLIHKLNELFQLDQPDLDFGFYRIMHAKSEQITQFIEHDLIGIIEKIFNIDNLQLNKLQENYKRELQTAKEYGVPIPEDSPKVRKAKIIFDTAKNSVQNEADVYDHLYRFFERYYEDGDFISRRYYTRETQSRAASYAVPYSGEEVKLHWANADQYYVKTTDYFNSFTFDPAKAPELGGKLPDNTNSLLVHFQVVEATEGAHGNIKDTIKRQFFLHHEKPIALSETGELIVNFEYRSAGSKDEIDAEQKETLKKRFETTRDGDIQNLAITATILDAIHDHSKKEKQYDNYLNHLNFIADNRKETTIKKLPVLGRYVKQYTARNTMDYFIHKNLGEFLHRELDFYIKNEVMLLDDIENADAPVVESYLDKIKVIRQIAGKLIDFLAQLENFQKKLWLKKKFITETNYCITLDKIPNEFYHEIVANKEQQKEWIRLFSINEIGKTLNLSGYDRKLSVDFLKENSHLVLDTKFFDENFKQRLIAKFDNLDEQCNALLIHSENFQALNLLQKRYREQIKCVYIDPPYNTDASEILYKNGYKDSSWLSLLEGRIAWSNKLLIYDGILCVTIDDFEYHYARSILEQYFGGNILGTIVIKNNPAGRSTAKGFSIAHEYAIFLAKNEDIPIGRLKHSNKQIARYKFDDSQGNFEWVNFRKHGGANANRWARPRLFYPIFVSENSVRFPLIQWNDEANEWQLLEKPNKNEKVIYPVTPNGEEKTWKWGIDSAKLYPEEFIAKKDQSNELGVYKKSRLNQKGTLPLTVWDKTEYSSTEYGTNLLKKIFGEPEKFSFPKSIHAITDCLSVCNAHDKCIVLDYFAGSGTTGHAVINLNRDDKGNRKFILVEMGEHFDTVLKPRILKVIYAPEWKDGKPTSRDQGISFCLKYIRLESYEDTLNNLEFNGVIEKNTTINNSPELKENFMLRYFLDVETRKSPSLLNIDLFSNPTNYKLQIKKINSDEYENKKIDLIETFNYLIGLRIRQIDIPQQFSAKFKRIDDSEAPQGQQTRLVAEIKQLKTDGDYWFCKIEGWVPKDVNRPDNGLRENVLIVWRKLTDDIEKDNAVLDEWFLKYRVNPHHFEYDTIYVNGDNSLLNLKKETEHWNVFLIEEAFMKKMWETTE
jgi:adenine-specific DNA-methyltransferase